MMSGRRLPLWGFVLWALCLSAPYWAMGPASYVRLHDNADSELARALALAYAGWQGWHPLPVCGLHAAAFEPWSLNGAVFRILPGWVAYGLLMFLQRFSAGYFTYTLLREGLVMRTGASLFGGVTYSLFAQESVNNGWAGFTLYDGLFLPCLPAVLLFLRGLASVSSMRRYLGAALMGVFMACGTTSAFAPFMVAAIVLWFLLVDCQRSASLWASLAVMAGVWLAVTLTVAPVIGSHVALSHRARWMMNTSLWAPSRHIKLSLDILRDNAVPGLLGIAGVIAVRGRPRVLERVMLSLFLCFGAVVLAGPITCYIIEPYLGFLKGIQIDRFYLAMPFFFAVLGAAGMNVLWEPNPAGMPCGNLSKRLIALRGAAVLLAVLATAYSYLEANKKILEEWLSGYRYASFYANPDVDALAKSRLSEYPFRVTTVAGMWGSRAMHPAFVWAYGLESVDGYVHMYPARYHDYWAQVIKPLTDQSQACHDYFHQWGSRVYLFDPAAYLPRVNRQNALRMESFYNMALLSLANVRFVLSRFPLEHEDLREVPSVTGAKREAFWKLSFRDRVREFLAGRYPGVRIYIYENTRALPRFFLTNRRKVYDDERSLLDALGRMNVEDLASTALVVRSDWGDTELTGLSEGGGTVHVLSYTPSRIELRVKTDGKRILVVGNNYSADWKVRINGKAARLLPVYHAFQGVLVSEGESVVTLEYQG